jgi:hypothetical protein
LPARVRVSVGVRVTGVRVRVRISVGVWVRVSVSVGNGGALDAVEPWILPSHGTNHGFSLRTVRTMDSSFARYEASFE